ncbi:hypothetical protein ABZ894_05100 [Nocardia beijingensis]|uniref:hypothetical protein n=1 Tax=Nocardia beijingensis TaxID=95162 RepID=UPI0033F788AB
MQIATVTEHASPLIERGGVDAGGRNRHGVEWAARRGHDGPHRGCERPIGVREMTGPWPGAPASPCHDAFGIPTDAVVTMRKTRPTLVHCRASEPR